MTKYFERYFMFFSFLFLQTQVLGPERDQDHAHARHHREAVEEFYRKALKTKLCLQVALFSYQHCYLCQYLAKMLFSFRRLSR